MNSEEWKDIIGYEGLYQVSSLGRVRSLDRYDSNNHFLTGRILKLCTDGAGYLSVNLCSNGKAKMYSVHRLVAEAFIPNPDNLPEVNHKDEDKTNNSIENLERCDKRYNLNYGSRIDRIRSTKIKNGLCTGLSREEYLKKYYLENKDERRHYMKKYYRENRDKICEQQKEYRRKKKEEHTK